MGHILQHKTDPVTGEPLASSQLIKLNMAKSCNNNNDNLGEGEEEDNYEWECPILNKPFNDYSKVVAIKISPNEANVYSYDAIHELNLKLKNYEDLISGVKFNKNKDIILLQDPNNDEHVQLRDICNFYHIKHNNNKDGNKDNINSTNNTRGCASINRIMEKLADSQNKKRKLL